MLMKILYKIYNSSYLKAKRLQGRGESVIAPSTNKLLRRNKEMELFVSGYTSYIFCFHSLNGLPYNDSSTLKISYI